MAHVVGGLLDTGTVIGFGQSLSSVAVGGATIDLTGAVGLATDMAFSVPRSGTLSQLSVFYSNVVGINLLLSTASVVVQVYRSTTPNNIFSPIPGALVVLPFSAVITLGTIANASTALAVSVSNQDRLLLVARVTITAGLDILATLTGYVSAGLAIT